MRTIVLFRSLFNWMAIIMYVYIASITNDLRYLIGFAVILVVLHKYIHYIFMRRIKEMADYVIDLKKSKEIVNKDEQDTV